MNGLLRALARCLKISCVEDEVEMRISEDEGVVESEDAAPPHPHHHPPTHNSEDYAQALAKYARVSHLYIPDIHKDKKTRGRDKDRGSSRDHPQEMALRQFSSLPELLKKLREDLKTSYLSFVKELVRDPHDGVTLLLDVLKTVQLAQTDINGNASSKEQQSALRRALIDEHECLSCLRYCLRCTDATLKLAHYHHGLYTLAVATMSNLARSRTIALQLLTRACETSTAGHRQVVDALSTLRLRFAEPVRCKFLVSMMLSHPQMSFQVWGLRFVNALVSTSATTKEKIYLQEELSEAGFDVSALKKVVDRVGGDSHLQSIAGAELDRWADAYIDVDHLDRTIKCLKDSNGALKGELQKLREANMKLLEENVLLKAVGGEVEEQLSALQRRLEVHGLPTAPSPAPSISDSDISSLATFRNTIQRNPSNSTCRSELVSVSPTRTSGTASVTDGERSLSPEWIHSELGNGHVKIEQRSSSRESGQGSSRSMSEVSTPEPVLSSGRVSVISPIDNHSDDNKSSSPINIEYKENNARIERLKGSPAELKYNEQMPTTHIDMTFSKSDISSVPEYANEAVTSSRSSNSSQSDSRRSSRPNSRQRVLQQHNDSINQSRLSSRNNSSGRSTPSSSSQLDEFTVNGKQSPAVSQESSSSKRKAPLPPSTKCSPFSSSTSSLSSSSSAASLTGGERKDPEYENVPRSSFERVRSRGANDEGDLDYERDMVVYEAITLGNDTIMYDKNAPSQPSTLGKVCVKDSNSNDNDTDQITDRLCVRQSVRHYENLALNDSNDDRDYKKEDLKTDDMKQEDKKREYNGSSIEDSRSNKNEDVTEKEVEAVMNGLENVLRNAESSLSLISLETVKENTFIIEDQYEDRASPNHQVSEEIEIVPTRVPQLPSRSRSRDNLRNASPVDPVVFLDYESPTETSDTETLRRFNKAPSSPRTMETESTKSFGYMKPVRRHETFMDRSNNNESPREEPRKGIKRSESFQMGNKGEYNSHRSYSPRRRGSTDLLVPLEESEIYINGRTFTRYSPQEVERRNKVNELITAELSRRKNRSLEDRLDQWLDSSSNDEWTLRWKYPEIHKAAEEALNRHKNRHIDHELSPSVLNSKKEGRKSSKNNDNKKNNKNKSSKDQPLSKNPRSGKGGRFSNKDITAFNGFKNPSADMYHDSDYGPNFMLNKPGQRRSTDISDYGQRDPRDQRRPSNPRKSKDPRDVWSAGRRNSEPPDPDIPTPDYTVTPGSTLSTAAMNGPGGKHILDMPSGLY